MLLPQAVENNIFALKKLEAYLGKVPSPKSVENVQPSPLCNPHPRQQKFCNPLHVKNFQPLQPFRVENFKLCNLHVENSQHFQFFYKSKAILVLGPFLPYNFYLFATPPPLLQQSPPSLTPLADL